MEGAPGAAFGPYRIEELISQSATASVHRATDTRHGGRAVALKLFAPHLSGDPAFRDRFRRDVGMVSALRDPHVVPIHTYGEQDGVLYLDMRLVHGRSLAAVRRAGGIDAERMPSVIEQLDAAVAALRAGGLGNRPVTAEDVLLSGPPGREFVHVVGLGLGRPPVGGPADVVGLVGPPARPRARSRRWWPVAAGAAVLVLVVAVIVAARASSVPGVPLAAGQIAALSAEGPALAAATTTLDGTPVVVTTAGGAIRTWNLMDGRSAAPVIDIRTRSVSTTSVDDVPVVVSRGPDQLVHVNRLADGREMGGPFGVPEPVPPTGSLEANRVRDTVTTQVAGRSAVVAAQATESERIPELGFAVWSLPDGEPITDLVSPGSTVTLELATAMVGETAVVVTVGADGQVQVYDAATGGRIGGPIAPGVQVTTIDVVDRGAGPVVVAGCADNSVRLFDLRTGAPVGSVLRGHIGSVGWVSAVRSGGRDIVVSTAGGSFGSPAETRFWDLDTGAQVGPVLAENRLGRPLATADASGRGVLVTSAPDGAAVWDIGELLEGGAP